MSRKPVSDEAVQKSTGKTLNEWFLLLDKHNAKDWSHKQIADWLINENHIKNGWWAQTVTVEYELHHGKRVVGQTKDAGFQIGVQKTIPINAAVLWDILTSGHGLSLWLGKDASLTLEKAGKASSVDWTGEVRSIDPEKKLRLRLQQPNRPASTLQLYFMPSGDEKTSLRFHHEKLQDQEDRATMKLHWQQALNSIHAYVTNGKP